MNQKFIQERNNTACAGCVILITLLIACLITAAFLGNL